MLVLELTKTDKITLYHKHTHQKLGEISLSLKHRACSPHLAFDFPNDVVILRDKAKRREP